LPPALARLCGEYPQVCVAFKAASGRDFSRLLSIGAADVALGFDAEPAPGLECVASCELPVGAIVHGDHPLAKRGQVTLEECAGYPMILPDRSWPLRDLMDQHVARLAVEPTTVTSSSSVEFLRFMLERQNGVGFCTIIAIEAQVASGELRHLPLFAPDAVVQQFGIWAVANERRGRHLETLLTLLSGRLVLLVSAELDEVLELSDRIAVMYRGELVATLDGPTAEREQVGLLMATGRAEAAEVVPPAGPGTSAGTPA
jgi:DNA-binding transcriptional LysR family regulator